MCAHLSLNIASFFEGKTSTSIARSHATAGFPTYSTRELNHSDRTRWLLVRLAAVEITEPSPFPEAVQL